MALLEQTSEHRTWLQNISEENEDAKKRSALEDYDFSCFLSSKYIMNVMCHELHFSTILFGNQLVAFSETAVLFIFNKHGV